MSIASAACPSSGRILALDVGERRVGVAVSDLQGWLARPHTIISRRSKREDFAAIGRLVSEQEAGLVVIGHPLNMNGSVGPQARRVERYAASLRQVLAVPVVLWDERLSTEDAAEKLRAAGVGRRRQRRHLDDVAAAVFLQEYLDAHRSSQDLLLASQVR